MNCPCCQPEYAAAERARLEVENLHTCGFPEGSFACKIRHIQINTGAAKAARD